MRRFVKLVALLLFLTSLILLGYGSYWVNPTAFLTKLRLLMGTVKSETGPAERGLVCDFEAPRDIAGWKSDGCILSLSSEYRKSGLSGAKLSFDGGAAYAGTKLEDYVFGPGSIRDWSSFERLSFWLRNGGSEGIKLDIQVKDTGEHRFYHSVHLGPHAEERISIGLERLSDTVDLERIASIIIGSPGPVGDTAIFIDEIRLEGEGEPLGKPYITFSGLEIPSVAYRGKTFTINGYLRTEKPLSKDNRIFLHIYPESLASVPETSERAGLINADHFPPVRTSLWEAGVDEPIGPLEIYIPEDNPSGTYLIELGLFNHRSPGRGARGTRYTGAHDFSGSYPRCRYTNPEVSGYVVGRMEIL